ncbi:SRPBCC domain-containing protein [Paenibacillus albicereus]|uniref:SRPBCC domain-containing protein n=1 Tax=Paenibacillus albicereus TaxID=2726185 RepID=A0A6H2GY25_9BACL|nr:SRPBCC domain-containing protein [Paenibacillus albicereus]QJC52076.1 SRPBCC domain-containing protein [Paenibacillus albicereus]
MANIEHLQTIRVPASAVYEALTTAKGLSEVWTDELIVTNEIGSVMEFLFGGKGLTKMRVEELVMDTKVIWQCVDSDPEWIGTTISFELEEKNGKTTVLLRQLNWKEVTAFYRACNYNWAMFLYSLKLYCEEGEGLPYQKRKF